MIQGRYVKDNNYTEIYVGNGMTEIVPARPYDPHTVEGLSYFWWPKEVSVEVVKKRSRNWIWWSIVVAAFLLGTALGAIVQRIYYAIPLFIVSLGWISLVAWVNRK